MGGITYLRPEAVPLPWNALDDSQQEAFRALVTMLVESLHDVPQRLPVGAPPPSPDPNWMPWLDFNRKVRVALLSGFRGSGKTSVMLSLLRAFRPQDERTAGEWPSDVADWLRALRHRVVWLAPLDMAPLPRTTNLFAAILARIENVIERRGLSSAEGESADQAGRSLLEPGSRYHSSMANLHRLQLDVAVAWEGNVRERAGQLDPNAYAMEVMRAETVRLSLNERLNSALDRLASEVFLAGDARNPMFVLPIDDFDLNPTRCVELLDLLRTISVPRLFFIVLGDVDVAQAIVNLQLSGDATELARNPHACVFLPIRDDEVASRLAELAANTLRKLVPPSQRVKLQPLQLDEAIAFRPRLNGGAELPTLGDLLQRCPAPIEKESWDPSPAVKKIDSLNDLLLVKSMSVYPTAGSTLEYAYTARSFLESPPRLVADWWLAMQHLSEQLHPPTRFEEQKRLVLETVKRFCLEAVEQEPHLSTSQRQRLTESLRRDVFPHAEAFRIEPRIGSRRSLREKNGGSGNDGEVRKRIELNSVDGWALSTEMDPERGKQLPQRLSSLTTNLLVFYTDLRVFSVPWPAASPLLPESPFVLARTLWEHDGASHAHEWPIPPFRTLWEFDLFLSGWRQWVARVNALAPMAAQTPIFHWLNLSAAALLGETPIYDSVTQPHDWRGLGERLERVLELNSAADTHQRSDVFNWLGETALLFTPMVLGDDDEIGKGISWANKLANFWIQDSQRKRYFRFSRAIAKHFPRKPARSGHSLFFKAPFWLSGKRRTKPRKPPGTTVD